MNTKNRVMNGERCYLGKNPGCETWTSNDYEILMESGSKDSKPLSNLKHPRSFSRCDQ